MSVPVQTLVSEVIELNDDALAEFGEWFKAYWRTRPVREWIDPGGEPAHQEEIMQRRADYLADRTVARPLDAAYILNLRKDLYRHA